MPAINLPPELKAPVGRFETVLDSVSGLRLIESAVSADTVWFMCRDNDPNQWTKVMTYFIAEAPDDWDVFIARRFLKVKRDGRVQVAYAWHIEFKSEDLPSLLEQAGGLLAKADHFRRTGKATPGPGAVDFVAKSDQGLRKKAPTGPVKGRKYGETELPMIGKPPPSIIRTTDSEGFRKEFRPTGVDHPRSESK